MLFVLLFVLQLALLLDIQLRFLPLFFAAFILLTSGTHNRFSFRSNDWRLIPSHTFILTLNFPYDKMETYILFGE